MIFFARNLAAREKYPFYSLLLGVGRSVVVPPHDVYAQLLRRSLVIYWAQ